MRLPIGPLLASLSLALMPVTAQAQADMADLAMPQAAISNAGPSDEDLVRQMHRARYHRLTPADGSRADVILRMLGRDETFANAAMLLMAQTRFDVASRATIINGLDQLRRERGAEGVDQAVFMLMALEMPYMIRPERAELIGQAGVSQLALGGTRFRYIPPVNWHAEDGPVWMTEWQDMVYVMETSRNDHKMLNAGGGLSDLVLLHPALHPALRDLRQAAPKGSKARFLYDQLLEISTTHLLKRQNADAFFKSLAAAPDSAAKKALYADMHLSTLQEPALLQRLISHADRVQGAELLALLGAAVQIADLDPQAVLGLLTAQAKRVAPAQLDALLGLTIKLGHVMDADKLRPLRLHLFAEADRLGVLPDDPLLLTLMMDDPDLAPVLLRWVQRVIDPYLIDLDKRLAVAKSGTAPDHVAYRQASYTAENRKIAVELAKEMTYGSPIWGQNQRFDRTLAVQMVMLSPHPEMLIARAHRHGHLDTDAMAGMAEQVARKMPCALALPILGHISEMQMDYPGLRERLAALPFTPDDAQWLAIHAGDWQQALADENWRAALFAKASTGLTGHELRLWQNHLYMLDQMGLDVPKGLPLRLIRTRGEESRLCHEARRHQQAGPSPTP